MDRNMTSENKISIVIAFGLLIFVSMLVADHFSSATDTPIATLGDNTPAPPVVTPTPLRDGSTLILTVNTPNQINGDEIHKVINGETLRSICSQHYGDSGLANALAEWNNLPNANAISHGQHISLPIQSSLITRGFPINKKVVEITKPVAPAVNNTGIYVVKSGDTLSEIAQYVMGSAKKVQLLIDYNRNTMPNPDRIQVGMQLKYPLQ